MRIEELTPELVEKAKMCETREERLAFIEENGIELSDVQLESIAGGAGMGVGPGDCPKASSGHDWELTGRTRPGKIWGDTWPDYEKRCKNCGKVVWHTFKWSW